MKKTSQFLLLAAALGLFTMPADAQVHLDYHQQVFDFGHVGIDYLFQHNYKIPNGGTTPIRLTKLEINCDCTTGEIRDSVIPPGDTGIITVMFNTKDNFGPTNKSVKVYTDNDQTPEFDLYYVSIVGRWYDGLKPAPIGLFFLKREPQSFDVISAVHDYVEVDSVRNEDTLFTVKVVKGVANKNEKLQFEITPNPNLAKGTYHGDFSAYIRLDHDKTAEPTALTTPVKIVFF